MQKNSLICNICNIFFQDGKRYYKVKWESSWECEENLGDYQDLVDQFWDFVKRVSNEEDAEVQSRKRVKTKNKK